MNEFKAVNDKIVVSVGPVASNQVTDGGICLPQTYDDGTVSTGTVLSVGSGVKDIQVGDVVFFEKNGVVQLVENVFAMYDDYVYAVQSR
jgi:co-chaperonin GroES (HSP10)